MDRSELKSTGKQKSRLPVIEQRKILSICSILMVEPTTKKLIESYFLRLIAMKGLVFKLNPRKLRNVRKMDINLLVFN